MRIRVIFAGILIVGICTTFAVGGFAYGAYIQFSRQVFADEGTLAKDALILETCTGQGCEAVRHNAKIELPLMYFYYAEDYKLLHKPFPRNVITITTSTWLMRHSVVQAKHTKSPQKIQASIENLTGKKLPCWVLNVTDFNKSSKCKK